MEPESRAGAEFFHPLASKFPMRLSARKTVKWRWIFLGVLTGLPIYYVRELLASLFLFSLVFLAGSLLVLIVLLACHGTQAALGWVRTTRINPRRWAASYK